MDKTALCYGHRGVGCSIAHTLSEYPENTLTSIGRAVEYGSHGVEFDVYLTDLDDIVLCHGGEPDGRINYNYLRLVDGKTEVIPDEVTCQNLTIPPEELVVKMPWIKGRNADEVKRTFPGLTKEQRERITADYVSDNTPWRMEDGSLEHMPKLEHVLDRYGEKLKYNIELKGTKPELGLKVLKILERYPNLDVMISSFTWVPPELSPDSPHHESELEHWPNGRMKADILRPLVDKLPANVSLGVLFNYEKTALCSVPRIIEIAKSYKAKFVNVVHDFWIEGEGLLGGDPETGKDALKHLVERLHREDISVLTYWCQSPDLEEDYRLHIEAGVDIICPNDIKVAMKLVNQHVRV
ncbi:conserved hypothetical protein [Theileria equi strain WA]|uniref:GP-PDE domain-containing protein n=1 Tax=Theileria equi strain WA TaxID=1537102 RepID=L1LA70_THEEQ|nr:conserved hypothetical protein [Theileria equi strain WA]EKX72154.1 conserved hypothetical protein [Theileria equi strain WA]|eukprot:XP_004831606.1 conserved hypothetical protein [Theileria equi strain WA]